MPNQIRWAIVIVSLVLLVSVPFFSRQCLLSVLRAGLPQLEGVTVSHSCSRKVDPCSGSIKYCFREGISNGFRNQRSEMVATKQRRQRIGEIVVTYPAGDQTPRENYECSSHQRCTVRQIDVDATDSQNTGSRTGE